MILYYRTKFRFNTMNSFRVMGSGHSSPPPPPHPAQAPQKKARAGRVKSLKTMLKWTVNISILLQIIFMNKLEFYKLRLL